MLLLELLQLDYTSTGMKHLHVLQSARHIMCWSYKLFTITGLCTGLCYFTLHVIIGMASTGLCLLLDYVDTSTGREHAGLS